jgi:hypothetical protein
VEAGSNTSTVTLRVVGGDEKGSLKSETVKYGRETQGPAAHTKDRPVLSSERAPHKIKTVTVTQVIKIWSLAPNGCFIPRQNGRLTVGRNIKLNSTQLNSTQLRGIVIVRSRYQETSSEDTADWKRLSVCCSDL